MIKKWLPIMVQSPQLILTFAVVGSAWDDVMNNCLAMVKELIQLTSSSNEAILLAGLNLLASEMWSCDKEMRTHDQSLINIIAQCGGMQSLENQTVAEIAAV
jgi:hypothetical protein